MNFIDLDIKVKEETAIVYDFCESLSDKRFYGHLVPGKNYVINQETRRK